MSTTVRPNGALLTDAYSLLRRACGVAKRGRYASRQISAYQMSSRLLRIAFGVATLLAGVALGLHIANWFRTGVIAWPAAVNMVGLLVLTTTGLVDPPAGYLRTGLTILALALIFPSAVLIFLH